MDVFVETLVKHKLSQDDRKKVVALFVTLIISSILFILVIPMLALSSGLAYISTVSMLVFAVIVFVIWRVLKSLQLEFEYIVTNFSLDIDKIIDKKKRARLISVDLKTVEEVGVYKPSAFVNSSFNHQVHAERDSNGVGNYYLIVYHPTHKRTLIVFSPDDRMLEALESTLPRQISKNLISK